MNSRDPGLSLEPAREAMGVMTVTAQVKPVEGVWEVLVIISRRPGMVPMEATEPQVRLVAADSKPLDLLEAPKGILSEWGGGLGTATEEMMDRALEEFQDLLRACIKRAMNEPKSRCPV